MIRILTLDLLKFVSIVILLFLFSSMFSGIVQTVGSVKEITKDGEGRQITISSSLDTSKINIGESICVSGCCLTLVAKKEREMVFYISADTLKKTTLAMLSKGSSVNLEPSLKVGDSIGGHFITGHVDETGRILGIESVGIDTRIKIEVSNFGKNLLVQRGSIAIDGISLTVAYINGNIVTLNIIPHTWENTTLKLLKGSTNALVNVEFEAIAKHVYKIVKNLIAR